MGAKNIAISDERYEMLKAVKKPDECFTEVIERMRRKSSVLNLGAILPKREIVAFQRHDRAAIKILWV